MQNETTRGGTRIGIVASAFAFLIATALLPEMSSALDQCKVKVVKGDGTVLVSATGVNGTLKWGGKPGQATNALANADVCLRESRATNCELGPPGTKERITPPELCTIHLLDDSGRECAAFIKGCTPGIRVAGMITPDQLAPGFVTGVVDGNGQRVGNIIGVDSNTPVVLLNAAGQLFSLKVTKDSFIGTNATVFFQEPNCSGQAMVASFGGMLREAEVGPLGSTVYTAVDPNAEPTTFPGASRYQTLDGVCVNVVGDVTDALLASPLIDLDTVFVPPFQVQ